MKLTREQVEAGKSERGGFKRSQLAKWGVPWPPPKGWRRNLEGSGPPRTVPKLDLPAWNYADPMLFEAERLRQEMKSVYSDKSAGFPELTSEELEHLERCRPSLGGER